MSISMRCSARKVRAVQDLLARHGHVAMAIIKQNIAFSLGIKATLAALIRAAVDNPLGAELNPTSVAVNAAGILVAADGGSYRILRISAAAETTYGDGDHHRELVAWILKL